MKKINIYVDTSVKAVEMVRKIRDQHYGETKGFSVAEQIKFVKQKSEELRKKLKRCQCPTTDKSRLCGSR